MTATLAVLAWTWGTFPTPAMAARPRVVLSTTALSANPEPKDFSCFADRIYAIVLFPKPVPGNHLLEGYWYRPGGIPQERTKITFVMDKRTRSAYIWLKFDMESNPVAAAMGRDGDNSFTGAWTLDVFWDGKKIGSRSFHVDCG